MLSNWSIIRCRLASSALATLMFGIRPVRRFSLSSSICILWLLRSDSFRRLSFICWLLWLSAIFLCRASVSASLGQQRRYEAALVQLL